MILFSKRWKERVFSHLRDILGIRKWVTFCEREALSGGNVCIKRAGCDVLCYHLKGAIVASFLGASHITKKGGTLNQVG